MRLSSAIIIGVAALVVSIGVLGTPTALARTSPEMTHLISQHELKGREAPTGLDPSLLIQAAVPLTDPDLDIILDCLICPDEIDTNYGTALWAASGQGRVRGDREQFRGRGLLSINDADSFFRFKFKEIDQIIPDGNDDPFGVVFSGQAQVTDSEGTERFRFTAAVMPATEAPERLIWDIRGSNNLSLQFEANGRLTFSER